MSERTIDLEQLAAELTAAGIHVDHNGNGLLSAGGWLVWDDGVYDFAKAKKYGNDTVFATADIIRRHVAPVAPPAGAVDVEKVMAAVERFGQDYCTCPGCKACVVDPQRAEIRAMLTPAPVPEMDAVCANPKCGHPRSWHCEATDCGVGGCGCYAFRLTPAQPSDHEWSMIVQWRNESRSSDQIDYCTRCGIVRKSYVHASGEQVSPTYFGVDVPYGTVEVPNCVVIATSRQPAPAPVPVPDAAMVTEDVLAAIRHVMRRVMGIPPTGIPSEDMNFVGSLNTVQRFIDRAVIRAAGAQEEGM